MSTPIGFTMPLARTTSSLGFLATTTDQLDATHQNLKSLVLTNWGERVGHYFLGCNLAEYLFAPLDQETADQIKQRIETQVAKWLPYVTLYDVTVEIRDPGFVALITFGLQGQQDFSSVLEVPITAGE